MTLRGNLNIIIFYIIKYYMYILYIYIINNIKYYLLLNVKILLLVNIIINIIRREQLFCKVATLFNNFYCIVGI